MVKKRRERPNKLKIIAFIEASGKTTIQNLYIESSYETKNQKETKSRALEKFEAEHHK